MRALPLFSESKPTITRLSTLFTTSSSPLSEAQFISLIHSSKTTPQLQQIHAQLILHSLSHNSRLFTQLVSSSSLLNSIDYALSIFRHFDNPNSFIFNALIRGLSENARFESAILHLTHMLGVNVRPDRLTFPFVLRSAAALAAGELGGVIHGLIVKVGVEFDSFVRVSLVDMYVKVGCLGVALQVFDESPERIKHESVILWNVLINGCCRGGELERACEMFEAMPERSSGSWNSLINGFLRAGDLGRARRYFDRMPPEMKNVVTWTTMISGFSQNEDHEQALGLFHKMLEEGVRPNDHTIVSALSACASIGALQTGVWIHEYISKNGFRLNRIVGTALVDMYAKCGKIDSASQVFGKVREKDLLTWTVMISGWATNGCSDLALQCFEDMRNAGVRPDDVVFLAILTACSHSGLVNEGLRLFNIMRFNFAIEPNVKHYASMVDLFGRAGQLEEALNFIENIPIKPDFVVWGALFCACRAHKNIEMAELASDKLLQLEPTHPGSYIFLSNIYAGVGRWEDVERVRLTMKSKGIEKPPGWSYIEVDGQVHRFLAGDKTHLHSPEVYTKLEELIVRASAEGYNPDTKWVLSTTLKKKRRKMHWEVTVKS